MAKKVTPQPIMETTVEGKLQTLYELQTILTEIDEIRNLRGELPMEVKDLEDSIEGLNARLEKIEDQIKKIDSDMARFREERRIAEELVARDTEIINSGVRNSREFDLLSKEVEYQNLEIQLLDKKMREATDARIARLEEVAKTKEEKAEREADLSGKASELDDIVAETKVREDGLREKVKELEFKVDDRLLTAFRRIRKNSHNGLGIVYVQRGACGGCFAKIPPQRQLDVRLRKKVIVCEYCGRIMIDPELAGVQIEQPVEAPKKRVRRTKKTVEETEETAE